ncbi:MAG TPA: glycosyltransferase family 2 protein [Candidatus Paceibacterota bacterium]|nr:glycosyltransferase family 2 protein [Candidatus Paceibacterota bacterium]
MKPLISVIIPAHNSEKTIGTAIESMIGQTWTNLEIIVIDDNSTDDTKSVVEAYAKKDPRVRYYALPFDDPHRVNRRGRNVNAGYLARNYGFEKSSGEYITFQDADDASFKNRIEIQYDLLKKHDAVHVTLDWQMLGNNDFHKRFNVEAFLKDRPIGETVMVGPDEIMTLAEKTKGAAMAFLGPLRSKIDFEWKRARLINKAFFGSLDGYPGTGNSPLFKREVMEKVKFRSVNDRVWPSFVGRGADRDFNFQVAETFGQSYVFYIPMYLWRQDKQNERYGNLSPYIA